GIASAITVVMMTTPQYQANATLEISLEQVKMVDVGSTVSATPMTDTQSLETNYGLLRSRSLAERVARDMNLANDPAFANQESPPESRLRQATAVLSSGFTVTPIPSSRLVTISFKHPDPAMAA